MDNVDRTGGGGGGQVQQTANQARQQAGQALQQAQEKARPQVEGQKERAAEQLGSISQALRKTGDQLRDQGQGGVASFAERGADQVERFSDYLRERDIGQMIGEAERFARREPAMFLAGAFGLGLLAARFLKSSSRAADGMERQTSSYTGSQVGYGRGATEYGQGLTGYARGATSYGGETTPYGGETAEYPTERTEHGGETTEYATERTEFGQRSPQSNPYRTGQ